MPSPSSSAPASTACSSEAIGAHPDQPRDDADRWWLPVSRGGTAPGREEGLRLDEEGMRRADLAAEARILPLSQPISGPSLGRPLGWPTQ